MELLCQVCEVGGATAQCMTCKNNSRFCGKCLEFVHADELKKSHVIEKLPLDPSVQSTRCQVHGIQETLATCQTCHKNVCLLCLTNGEHASHSLLMLSPVRDDPTTKAIGTETEAAIVGTIQECKANQTRVSCLEREAALQKERALAASLGALETLMQKYIKELKEKQAAELAQAKAEVAAAKEAAKMQANDAISQEQYKQLQDECKSLRDEKAKADATIRDSATVEAELRKEYEALKSKITAIETEYTAKLNEKENALRSTNSEVGLVHKEVETLKKHNESLMNKQLNFSLEKGKLMEQIFAISKAREELERKLHGKK